MVVLGGGVFLISEVPLYVKMARLLATAKAGIGHLNNSACQLSQHVNFSIASHWNRAGTPRYEGLIPRADSSDAASASVRSASHSRSDRREGEHLGARAF